MCATVGNVYLHCICVMRKMCMYVRCVYAKNMCMGLNNAVVYTHAPMICATSVCMCNTEVCAIRLEYVVCTCTCREGGLMKNVYVQHVQYVQHACTICV